MRDTQTTLARLDALIRFRDRLFSVVIHDLRWPATSILLAADVLADAPQRDDGEELLEMIRNATRRQLPFSKTRLDQMRRDTLRLDVRPESVDAGALLERAVEDNRLVAERRGLTFQIEQDVNDEERPDEELHTDARLAGQVLQNLIANAVAFSPTGGTVALHTAWTDDHVAFSVRDEGVGMTKEEAETLFEPFRTGAARRDGKEQSGAPEALSEGGFGLGLWIARTFAKLLGGSLAVDSAPGEGSTFEVRLPRTPPHAASSTRAVFSGAPEAPAFEEPATAASPSASARR